MKNKDEIVAEVTEVAEKLGHKLKPFTSMIINDAYHSTCENCGAYTSAILHRESRLGWVSLNLERDRISKPCAKAKKENS